MRHWKIAIALAVLPAALAGCAGAGSEPAAEPTTGPTWLLVEAGQPTPSPSRTPGRATPSPSTAGTALPAPDPSCAKNWPRTHAVLIPVEVTPGAGSLKVEWPTQHGSDYRVAAVPQRLVSGAQPEPVWKSVPAGTGCAVGTTLTGLVPGDPYIVWLDAPNSGRQRDGSRNLYSGRSGVVVPN